MRSAFTLTWVALCAGPAFAASAPKNPELTYIRHVYIAPMSNGLDQYLANRLTQGGRFAVVTDPQIAEAILTDRIGESFEAYFATLYPPPPRPKADEDDEAKTADENDGTARPRPSSFGRARGNLYLVDRGSRKVIWSEYRRARNTQPDQLDELADYFASRLRKQAGKAGPPPPAPPAPPSQLSSPEPKPDTAAPTPK